MAGTVILQDAAQRLKLGTTREDGRGIPTRDRLITIQIDDGQVYRIAPDELLKIVGKLLT